MRARQFFFAASVVLASGVTRAAETSFFAQPGCVDDAKAVFAAAAVVLTSDATRAAETSFTVQPGCVADAKAVFATVESRNVVPARARIGGTVVQLSVKDGDHVEQGQVIAVVGDQKLLLQVRTLEAQIAGLQSQVTQAQSELSRAEVLAKQGVNSRQQLEQAQTALDVATSTLRARIAERAVTVQQMTEGQVLAPTAGRVLHIPVVSGNGSAER